MIVFDASSLVGPALKASACGLYNSDGSDFTRYKDEGFRRSDVYDVLDGDRQ